MANHETLAALNAKVEQTNRTINHIHEIMANGASEIFPFEPPQELTTTNILASGQQVSEDRERFLQELQFGKEYQFPDRERRYYPSPLETLGTIRERQMRDRSSAIMDASKALGTLQELGFFEGKIDMLEDAINEFISNPPKHAIPLERSEKSPKGQLVLLKSAEPTSVNEFSSTIDLRLNSYEQNIFNLLKSAEAHDQSYDVRKIASTLAINETSVRIYLSSLDIKLRKVNGSISRNREGRRVTGYWIEGYMKGEEEQPTTNGEMPPIAFLTSTALQDQEVEVITRMWEKATPADPKTYDALAEELGIPKSSLAPIISKLKPKLTGAMIGSRRMTDRSRRVEIWIEPLKVTSD
jgi:hypothetical protein